MNKYSLATRFSLALLICLYNAIIPLVLRAVYIVTINIHLFISLNPILLVLVVSVYALSALLLLIVISLDYSLYKRGWRVAIDRWRQGA